MKLFRQKKNDARRKLGSCKGMKNTINGKYKRPFVIKKISLKDKYLKQK